jgi:hypothetical protein
MDCSFCGLPLREGPQVPVQIIVAARLAGAGSIEAFDSFVCVSKWAQKMERNRRSASSEMSSFAPETTKTTGDR